MKQIVLKNFDITWLPLTGLILFCLSFALYFYWTYKKSNKKHFEKMSLIPLEDSVNKGEKYEF